MIKARIDAENPEANIASYAESYKSFSWTDIEKEFTWDQSGKINIVHEAVDRWAERPEKQDQAALIFEKNGNVNTFSYLDLKEISCQWANLFDEYGFKTGDRLFIFLPPCPEIYFTMLACARLGILFCTLFSSSTFDELLVRLESAEPSGILTHPDLAERIPLENLEYIKGNIQ